MTALHLKDRGFEVVQCARLAEFREEWRPGTFDVIVADWELSHNPKEHGDEVLLSVRKQDWDVPFVLVSGKLDQGTKRAGVLGVLLASGNARFVARGVNGIEEACESAEDLIERRDLALLKVILPLREGTLQDATVQTSSGTKAVSELLADVVSTPGASHNAERPIANARSLRRTSVV